MVLSDMVRGCVCGCVGSCSGYFLFHAWGAGGRLTNKHKWVGEGKIRTILFDTKNPNNTVLHMCLNLPSYFRY